MVSSGKEQYCQMWLVHSTTRNDGLREVSVNAGRCRRQGEEKAKLCQQQPLPQLSQLDATMLMMLRTTVLLHLTGPAIPERLPGMHRSSAHTTRRLLLLPVSFDSRDSSHNSGLNDG